MPSLTKAELHTRILASLGSHVVAKGSVDSVPLPLEVTNVVPLAIWAFTLTNPPGGRHPAESKIQLIVPGQGRRDRANLTGPPERFKLLVGVHPEDDLYVLWDAYKQRDFTWSKNVQVRGQLLWDAQVEGIATGRRRLANATETVIVARGDRLRDGIALRIEAD